VEFEYELFAFHLEITVNYGVPALTLEVQLVACQDHVGVVWREVLNFDCVGIPMGTIVSRLEADSVHFYGLLHRNCDARLIAEGLVPFVPFFLTCIDDVCGYFFAGSATTGNSMKSLDSCAVVMQVNSNQVTLIVDQN
jgi:hypothetical protein